MYTEPLGRRWGGESGTWGGCAVTGSERTPLCSRWLSFSLTWLSALRPIIMEKSMPSSLSHTHLTLIRGRVRQTTERSWWEVQQPAASVCLCVCVCGNTYLYHHLTLSTDQPCHYGAFPIYRWQLSTLTTKSAPGIGRSPLSPYHLLPHGYHSNTVFHTDTS